MFLLSDSIFRRFYSLFTFFIRFFFLRRPQSDSICYYSLIFIDFIFIYFFIFVVIVISRIRTRVFVEFRVYFCFSLFIFTLQSCLFDERIHNLFRCVKCSAFKKPNSQTTTKSSAHDKGVPKEWQCPEHGIWAMFFFLLIYLHLLWSVISSRKMNEWIIPLPFVSPKKENGAMKWDTRTWDGRRLDAAEQNYLPLHSIWPMTQFLSRKLKFRIWA